MVLLLAGCGGSAALDGTLAWVEERDHDTFVARFAPADAPAEATSVSLEGSTFPAEADPLGEARLVLQVLDDERGHQERLWLVPPRGEPVAMGPGAGMVRNPAWSPDGAWLVVESNRASFRDLYRVERDGRTTRLTNDKLGNFEPDVALDGTIAFVSSRDGDAEIYVMGPDGKLPMRITVAPGNDTQPTWTPDGTRLTWLAWRGERVTVHVVERGETVGRPFRTEPDAGIDEAIAWSPAGDRVAVTTRIGPKDTAIDLLAADGTRIARLDGPGPDETPAWSPDGSHLVFASSRAGQPDLWVARADGSAIRPLVQGPEPEWLARWGR